MVPAGTSAGAFERPVAKTTAEAQAQIDLINRRVGGERLAADDLVGAAQLMLKMEKEGNFLVAQATLGYQMSQANAVADAKEEKLNQLIETELASDLKAKGASYADPQANITNGGAHAKNSIDMQEFMIVPHGANQAESRQMILNIDRKLGEIYQALGLTADPDDHGLGDKRGLEGGYKIEDLTTEKLAQIYADHNIIKQSTGSILDNLDLDRLAQSNVGVHRFVLEAMRAAVLSAGYKFNKSGAIGSVAIALDPATNEMKILDKNGKWTGYYWYEGRRITARALTGIFLEWSKEFPIVSIEDGQQEEAWDAWLDMIEAFAGSRVALIGDDLLVTQGGRIVELLARMKKRGMLDKDGKIKPQYKLGILIKVNQNGFLTTGYNNPNEGYMGTLEVIRFARQVGFQVINVSHRSQEALPEDNNPHIVDLAKAVGADYVKIGDPVQATRDVFYQRLLQIEQAEIAKQIVDDGKAVILGGKKFSAADVVGFYYEMLTNLQHALHRQRLSYGGIAIVRDLPNREDLMEHIKKQEGLPVNVNLEFSDGQVRFSMGADVYSVENLYNWFQRLVLGRIPQWQKLGRIHMYRQQMKEFILFGGNWKERKDITTIEQARAKAREFRERFSALPADLKAKVIIFPEKPWIKPVADELKGSNIAVGVQSLFFDPEGDLKAQINDAVARGATYANVGHSMHRAKGLTNEQANKIMQAILEDGRLIPWYTIEETGNLNPQDEIREARDVGLKGVPAEVVGSFPTTLEPTVLISTQSGTGVINPNLKASGEDALLRSNAVRNSFREKYGDTIALDANVGYGASVNSSNAEEIFSQRLVRNALIGGSSLEADEFYNLVVNAMKGSNAAMVGEPARVFGEGIFGAVAPEIVPDWIVYLTSKVEYTRKRKQYWYGLRQRKPWREIADLFQDKYLPPNATIAYNLVGSNKWFLLGGKRKELPEGTTLRIIVPMDRAAIAPVGPGGIDLNARHMNMDVSGEKVDIHFDKAMMAQFKSGDFSGVRPVIMSITPLASIWPLLGMKEPEEKFAGV